MGLLLELRVSRFSPLQQKQLFQITLGMHPFFPQLCCIDGLDQEPSAQIKREAQLWSDLDVR